MQNVKKNIFPQKKVPQNCASCPEIMFLGKRGGPSKAALSCRHEKNTETLGQILSSSETKLKMTFELFDSGKKEKSFVFAHILEIVPDMKYPGKKSKPEKNGGGWWWKKFGVAQKINMFFRGGAGCTTWQINQCGLNLTELCALYHTGEEKMTMQSSVWSSHQTFRLGDAAPFLTSFFPDIRSTSRTL